MKNSFLLIGLVVKSMMMSLMASTAKFQVQVLDADADSPIENASVSAGFVMGSRGWNNTPPANMDKALTSNDGCCQVSGTTDEGEAYCEIKKDGYYDSGCQSLRFNKLSLFRRWKPDDLVITIRLDRVEQPIPLFVRAVYGITCKIQDPGSADESDYENIITTNRTTFSYDFVQGDWLPPHGRGKYADLNVICRKESKGYETREALRGFRTFEIYRSHVEFVFTGEGNGVCQVESPPFAGLKIRTAPPSGYEPVLYRWRDINGERNDDSSRCYAFRVRTRKDENGKVVYAHYGKVYGDFWANYLRGGAFLYYFNPTPNDPNLEWDRKHNLSSTPGFIPGALRP